MILAFSSFAGFVLVYPKGAGLYFNSLEPAVSQNIVVYGKEGGKCNVLLFDDKWVASLKYT